MQPPPPPDVNMESILNIFTYQENIVSQCEERTALYEVLAQKYAENVSRVKVISDKFSRGKILKDM